MRKAPRSTTSSAPVLPTLEPHSVDAAFRVTSLTYLLTSASLPMKPMEGTPPMIELTRLNGSPLAINCDLIKYAEAAPDTVLTLITGEKLVVLEPCKEVSQRTLDYRASVLRQAWPEAASSLSAKSAFDADDRARHHSANESGE